MYPLSIITINYNNKAGLEKTIRSVNSQTCRQFEWIIIDGGSTDGSKEIIEKTADDTLSNVVFWCSEKDNGVYNAMNKGILKASGRYLQFLNSGDCYHNNDVLASVLVELNGPDIIYGDIQMVGKHRSNIIKYPSKISKHFILYGSIGHPSSFIKSSLLKNKGYREDLKIVSDWASFLEWYLQGKEYKHIDTIVSDFDTTGISCSNKDLEKQEHIKVLKDLFKEDLDWAIESAELYGIIRQEHVKKAVRILNKGGLRRKILALFLLLLDQTIKK